MTKGGKKKSQRLVCFCYSVSEETIIEAIRGGATSLMDVRRKTDANTGCGGCGGEVKKLLRKHVPSSQKEIAKAQETEAPETEQDNSESDSDD